MVIHKKITTTTTLNNNHFRIFNFRVLGYDLSDGYIDGLLIRLRDKGVSVRKAVVNIIKDILLFQPNNTRYSELCLNLLGTTFNNFLFVCLYEGLKSYNSIILYLSIVVNDR